MTIKGRDRSDLTSIQVTHDQKAIIDKAHELFTELNFKEYGFLSRGEFLAKICTPVEIAEPDNTQAFKELV